MALDSSFMHMSEESSGEKKNFNDRLKERLKNPYAWELIPELAPKVEENVQDEDQNIKKLRSILKDKFEKSQHAFAIFNKKNNRNSAIELFLEFFYVDIKDVQLDRYYLKIIARYVLTSLQIQHRISYDSFANNTTLESLEKDILLELQNQYGDKNWNIDYYVRKAVILSLYPEWGNGVWEICWDNAGIQTVVNHLLVPKKASQQSTPTSFAGLHSQPAKVLPALKEMPELAKSMAVLNQVKKNESLTDGNTNSIHTIMSSFLKNQVALPAPVKKKFTDRMFGLLGLSKSEAIPEVPTSIHTLYDGYCAIQQLYVMGMQTIQLGMKDDEQMLQTGIAYLEIAKMFAEELNRNLPMVQNQLQFGNMNMAQFGQLVADIKSMSTGNNTDLVSKISREMELAEKTAKEMRQIGQEKRMELDR